MAQIRFVLGNSRKRMNTVSDKGVHKMKMNDESGFVLVIISIVLWLVIGFVAWFNGPIVEPLRGQEALPIEASPTPSQ